MGQLHFRYPDEYEEVIQQLKKFVIQEYGSLYKYLGLVIIRYIKEGLERDLALGRGRQKPLPHATKKHIALLQHILYFEDEISKNDVEAFVIEKLRCIDKRTIKRYLQFLLDGRFIKVLKPLYSNVIYKVDRQRILDFLKRTLDEDEFKTIVQSKFVENKDNGNEIPLIQEAKEYAAERYEAGDSVEEISQKLEDFGLNFTKQSTRNFLRKTLREVRD